MKINMINNGVYKISNQRMQPYGLGVSSQSNLTTASNSEVVPAGKTITFGQLTKNYNKVMHLILDGVGVNTESIASNPLLGNMPYLTALKHNASGKILYRTIEASGIYVGLDDGEPGNSEVGHSVMGAGRNIKQSMVRLDEAIEDGSFFKNKEILNAINFAKKNNSVLHILSSISETHTHSKIEHVEAIIKMAKENKLKKLAVHVFLNGEGTSHNSSKERVKQMNSILKANGYPPVASMIGRNIILNKSNDDAKLEEGYKMLIDGANAKSFKDISEGLNEQLKIAPGVLLPPTIRTGSPRISDNDAVIFANYRTDRAKPITAALAYKDSNYKFLKNYQRPKNLYFVCMAEYDPKFKLPTVLDTLKYNGTLKEVLLSKGWHITSCAQQEKHSHVTYFYNGSKDIRNSRNEDIKLPGCTDPILLKLSLNDQVKILQNEMNSEKYNKHFIVANIANGDLIGHKGNPKLSTEAAKDIDRAVYDLVQTARSCDYAVVITADHGNIENGYSTKHTSNPVPCFIVLPDHEAEITSGLVRIDNSAGAALKSVAPTILDIMGVQKSPEMTGKSLIIEG